MFLINNEMFRNRMRFIFITFLLLVTLLLSACQNEDSSKDKERVLTMTDDSHRESDDTKRTELKECKMDEKCAKGGKNCKYGAFATEPSDCDDPPSLKCTCPPSKECQFRFNRAGIKDWWCLA